MLYAGRNGDEIWRALGPPSLLGQKNIQPLMEFINSAHQLSNEKNLGCLGNNIYIYIYIGDYTTQLCGGL